MRKGITETIAFAVLTFLMIGTLGTIAMQNVVGVGELLRRETTQLQAERIESTIYGLNSFEKAKVQMEFDGQSGYKLYSDGGDKIISYTFFDETRESELDEPFGISYTVVPDTGDGPFRNICVKKESSGEIRIEGGRC